MASALCAARDRGRSYSKKCPKSRNGNGRKRSGAPASVSSTAGSAQPANADFCRVVAMQDANGYGFDQATQQRVYARSYGQCVAIYNR